jgi:hypothetical protein
MHLSGVVLKKRGNENRGVSRIAGCGREVGKMEWER